MSGKWWPSPMSSIGSSLLAQMNSPSSSPSQASTALTQSLTATSWNLWFGGQSWSVCACSTGASLSTTVSSAEHSSAPSLSLTVIVCVPGANGPLSVSTTSSPAQLVVSSSA